MASITLQGVGKQYPDGTHAVRDLDLDVRDGEVVVLVGPSGSGKSTALRMVAGLEDATSGTISIDDEPVNDVEPKDRDLAMVFQSYALYPHMSVEENMGFALKMQGLRRAEVGRRVADVAGLLGLEALLARRPKQLSGGQRQRVALGRAIVRQPRAFLMDEPLSNLDAKLRVEMRAYLATLHKELGTTTVYVTHDQTEAMTMGDRVAVLRDGDLVQFDTPGRLYDAPADEFVAAFIGSPAMNLVRTHATPLPDGGMELAVGASTLRLEADALAARPAVAELARRGGEVVVGIRPEALEPAGPEAGDRPVLRLEVLLREALGADVLVHLAVDGPVDRPGIAGGSAVPGTARITARLSPSVRAEPGDVLTLTVAPERLRFFDAGTGARLD